MDWKPLKSAPFGRVIVVSNRQWGVNAITFVYWKNQHAKDAELGNWTDPPTHWLDRIPEVPTIPQE